MRKSSFLTAFILIIEFYVFYFYNSPDALKVRAAIGDTSAMFEIGIRCAEEGDEDAITNQCVLKWLKMAANAGNPAAQNEIGLNYLDGLFGEAKDYQKAHTWLQKSFEGGDEIAPLNLGRMYRDGLGVARDEDKALEFFIISVERGYQNAILEVAKEYAKNISSPTDIQKAIEYKNLALQYDYQDHGLLSETYEKDSNITMERVWALTNQKQLPKEKQDKLYADFDGGDVLLFSKYIASTQGTPKATQNITLNTSEPKLALVAKALALNIHTYNYFDRERLILNLTHSAANIGNREAILQMSGRYRIGDGVEQNSQEADYWMGNLELLSYQEREMDFIKYETGSCFGTCPIYTIYIYRDGRVDYLGQRFVPVHGVITVTLSYDLIAKIETLITAHTNKSLLLKDPKGCGSVTDMASTSITIHKLPPETSQKLYHYNGCFDKEGVGEIVKLIYDITALLPFKELGLNKYKEFQQPPFKYPSNIFGGIHQ